MRQHILGLTSLLLTPCIATAEDVRLTLERPIEFETLQDCFEAVEVLELMYRRFDVEPLALCETDSAGKAAPLSPPALPPEGEEGPAGPALPSPPLPWEREA